MRVNIGNVTLGSGTAVANAAALAQLFTASQLNRLADKYMGKRFNKVSAKKMAEKLWPALVEASKAVEKPTGPGRGNKVYTVVHSGKPVKVDDLPNQCRHFVEILRGNVRTGQSKDFTKPELLELFRVGKFKTRGNPWNNFHFYRRTLVKRGVMKR